LRLGDSQDTFTRILPTGLPVCGEVRLDKIHNEAFESDTPRGNTAEGSEQEVMFIEEVAAKCRVSRRTIERARRARLFPIPELPAIDKRPRWSRRDVERYLTSADGGSTRRGGRPLASAARARRVNG
jgi:hypothetical protein